ncbi:MAG: UDP-N-acetylpyruvoylglucosamine reductase [Candidatus Saccharibacteria bacterium]|jgi:UDP-N-acetylmuramate dehydrogenase|nr:UDP-N-acetylpyruvoylglucosamine reductase [Candidatus Saccharibacteria bacterium]
MVKLPHIQERVRLLPYTTMKVGGSADYFLVVKDTESVKEACDWAANAGVSVFVLGEGSNLVVSEGPIHRLVLKMEIMGFAKLHETSTHVTWRVGAGEHWDGVVERSVKLGLTGIEAMSMIPGTMGAAPVQNAGAYGQEIADTMVELEAYDLATQQFVTLKRSECDFGYRNSTFKTDNAGRYVITHVTIKLSKVKPKRPTYESLKRWLDEHKIDDPSVEQIREGVMAVRARILPDPSVVPNSGSFFKSPIVSAAKLAEIEKKFDRVPSYRYGNEYKIAAGWIVEQCGFKGVERFGLKVWDNHALVITNPNSATYNDLRKLVEEIVTAAKEKFGLELEPEPLFLS